MQSPGSIFGLAGTNTKLIPLTVMDTLGVRGAATLTHTAGFPPWTQFGVAQVV
jgi:hypothetical protein